MGMQINTNVAANNTYRSLSSTQNDLSKSLEKLSSGLRINRASDDAAGLALSEGLKSQIGGLSVAARNAQDGIGMVQTAEGGLNQTQSILQRLRDLGVQAANDSNNADSRIAIKTEADSLVSELGRIGGSTDFNGTKLLDGTTAKLNLQVGANQDAFSQIAVDLSTANVSKIAGALGASNKGLDFALDDAGAALAAGVNTFKVTEGTTVTTVAVDLGAADATAKVADIAAKLNADAGFSDKMVASVVRDAAGVATGINVKSLTGGVVDNAQIPAAAGMTTVGGAAAGIGGLDFTTASAAQASIKLVNDQITSVSTARASLGASQNRLESAVQTINVAKENLTASNSRIRDTDMAEEMVKFTRNNILSQAGTAMLAQANQSSQGVLQLLR